MANKARPAPNIRILANSLRAPWLKSLRKGVASEVIALWSLPRILVEAIYAQAFKRNDRDALRWLARNDRYFLLSCCLRRRDMAEEHVRDWVFLRTREVEADPDDHIDLWAREHYKSTIITFAGVIQEILKDAEITAGIFSADQPKAKDFVSQIKAEFEGNQLLKDLFPDILWQDPTREAPQWSINEGIIVKRKSNPKEATLEASGLLDGMATGKHFGLRVYDDVVTEEYVTTSEMIQKTTLRYELSEHLGTRTGRQWMIGTRYHYGDTYGQLIARGIWRERRYAATLDGTFDGEPLFLTKAQWEKKKKGQSKSTIAAQMLLDPLQGSENKFDPRWLRPWYIRPRKLSCYIMVDPSKGPHADSDNTAIVVVGMDVTQNKYLLGGYCHRMPLSRRWTLLKNTYNQWTKTAGIESVEVGYEQYGMQSDIEFFELQMLNDGFSFPIVELAWPRQGPGSKTARIERLEPDYRSGKMMYPGVFRIDGNKNPMPCDPMTDKDPGVRQQVDYVLKQNEPWRVAKPIKAVDEDGKLYDVLQRWYDEYLLFPFGPRRDFLDAKSRIYDMNPVPPLAYDAGGVYGLPIEPEVFVDS